MAKKVNPLLENLGNCFISCDQSLGGFPRCKLGMSNGYWTPKRIQIHGAPALQVSQGYREGAKEGIGYKIFVIGEAPGKSEDSIGLPFIGDDGKLLIELLEAAEVPLSDVYLTSATRCRPPKNRPPSGPEIKACLTHLYYEIKKHTPEIIVLAGRIPLSIFNIRKGGIASVRGEVLEKKLPYWEDGPTFKIVPTYHPRFLLRRQDKKLNSRVISDLKLVRNLYYGKEAKVELYQVKYKVCYTAKDVAEMVEKVKEKGSFAWDTESPNLKFHISPMMTLQISIGKDQNWIIPFYRYDPDAKDEFQLRKHFTNQDELIYVIDRLKIIFENVDIVKYGHNCKYDMNVIKRWLGLDTLGTVHDTALLHHLLDCYPPHGLKYLADIEFQIGNYASAIQPYIGSDEDNSESRWDRIPEDLLWPYGATDAEVTYKLGELYLYKVQANAKLWKLYCEESIPSIKSFQISEWHGTKVNKENIEYAKTYYIDRLQRAENECYNLTHPSFNPNSNVQVKEELIKRGFINEITAPTKSSGFCTDKNTLLSIDDPLAKAILKVRKYRKRLSTYVDRILEDTDVDGRVRYSFNLTGTVGGRQSCRVYHQMPKLTDEKEAGTTLRAIFCEEDDFDIVAGDFSQIEMRIFAYLTGEQELIYMLENNQDIHLATAAAALEIDEKLVSKLNRDNVGKPLNFGIIYGSKGFKIAGVNFENPHTGKIEIVGVERAQIFLQKYKMRYKKIKEFLEFVPEESLANGCVVKSVFGRCRYLPDLTSNNQALREAAEREATNFKIQSTAASINTRTIILIQQVLDKYKIGPDKVRFLITVHDANIWGVQKKLVPWFKEVFRTVAQRPIPEIQGKSFPISIGVGPTWADAEINSKET